MRKTRNLALVAMALMQEPNGRHWGYALSRFSGVRSGAMYPILTRLLEQGWLRDGWEDPAAITEKRPPRRYYELTDAGRVELGAIARQADRQQLVTRPRYGFAGGTP